MNKLFTLLFAAIAAFGVMLSGTLAPAQQAKSSAAAIASAKEILAAKNVNAIYQGAVPGLVQTSQESLLQSNLNYQKDLDEVAVKVAKDLAGREQEIGGRWQGIMPPASPRSS